jgi:hypothetical protein
MLLGWARRTKIQRSLLEHSILQNSESCGKISPKCQFCQIMAIDQTAGSVNGSVVWSMAHWSDHQVFQWPLIRPPSLCRWSLIRPLCNNPNGHWSDQQLCQSMATIRASNLPNAHIRDHQRPPNDHWSVGGQLNRPLGTYSQWAIDQTVGSPFNGPLMRDHWVFQWLLIRLLDPLNWLPGSSPRAAIFICDIHACIDR